MPPNVNPTFIAPTVLCDTLDTPPQFRGDISQDPFVFGNLAANIPNAFANGHAYGRISQIPAPDPVHFTDDDARQPVSM
jgi:hypothetical protein